MFQVMQGGGVSALDIGGGCMSGVQSKLSLVGWSEVQLVWRLQGK